MTGTGLPERPAGNERTRILAIVGSQADADRARAAGADAIVSPFEIEEPVPLGDRLLSWTSPEGVLEGDRLSQLAERGADTLMIDAGRKRLLDRPGFAALSRIADACRAYGLDFGFAGALEAADVPRLLPLRPLFLAFRCPAVDSAALTFLVALTEPVASPPRHDRPDRVFIRDFVQEMELGAYASESGRRQRVSFSVEAELAPIPGPPSLGDIYSYDRMMDAVRALAARAPEAFVETLAQALAAEILTDPRVQAVGVRVEKLDLGPGAAGAEIRRERPR